MDYDKEITDLTLSDDEVDEPTPSSSMKKEQLEMRIEALKYLLLSPVNFTEIYYACTPFSPSNDQYNFK